MKERDGARRASRRLAAGILAAGLAACAAEPPVRPVEPGEAPPRGPTAADMASTAESLLGRTAGDVIAALGPATVVRFESGYEIWVYRFVEPAPGKAARRSAESTERRDAEERAALSELVMLLTPSGVVSRARVRSAAR